MRKILNTTVILVSILILTLSIRGVSGNPNDKNINDSRWKEDGPFELSPERGRFALTYSLIEDKSVSFSEDIARFTLPDLGYKNGKYVSLFAPGVSFIAIPGYFLGRLFGVSQFGAYITSAIFAIFNIILIRMIAKKLGANDLAAIISSLIFLFATPAFSYATTLYQHHISTFLMLLSVFVVLSSNSFYGHVLVWFLYASAVVVDYPNGLLMLPIIIFSLGRIFVKKVEKENAKLVFHAGKLTAFVGAIPILLFLFWFNNVSYGNPIQLSGTVDDVYEIDYQGTPILSRYPVNPNYDANHQNIDDGLRALGFFKTRNLINGLYVHLISPDRGIILYAPIILFGIFGIKYFGKKRSSYAPLLISIAAVNLILYSMWGDPWGGWGYGSRYLIPNYAVLSIFISFILSRFSRNIAFLAAFFLVVTYSLTVNTLGAITSSSNPPKIEAQALSVQYKRNEKYTFERNWDLINENNSKSFIFRTVAHKYLSAWQYFVIVSTMVLITITSPLVYLYMFEERKKL